MKVLAKRMVRRTVDVEIEIISARVVTKHCPEGLWQSLKRKSAISGKPFPEGSYVVAVMYIDDGEQQSGSVRCDELPDDIQAAIDATGIWKAEGIA